MGMREMERGRADKENRLFDNEVVQFRHYFFIKVDHRFPSAKERKCVGES